MNDRLDYFIAALIYLGIGGGAVHIASIVVGNLKSPIWTKQAETSSADHSAMTQCLITLEDFNAGRYDTLDQGQVRKCQKRLNVAKK